MDRNVLKHCILLDRDALLPRMSSLKFGETYLIVASTDQSGAEALLRRIREQLTYCEGLQNTEFHTTVSFTMVNTPPKWDVMPLEQFVRYISSSIEGKMKNGRIKEGFI